MNSYILKLYIMGQTPRSAQAIADVQRICDEFPGEPCEMTVIDVLEHPDIADQDKILATPTLIKVTPPPVRRVIGDLSNVERVRRGLGLALGKS